MSMIFKALGGKRRGYGYSLWNGGNIHDLSFNGTWLGEYISGHSSSFFSERALLDTEFQTDTELIFRQINAFHDTNGEQTPGHRHYTYANITCGKGFTKEELENYSKMQVKIRNVSGANGYLEYYYQRRTPPSPPVFIVGTYGDPGRPNYTGHYLDGSSFVNGYAIVDFDISNIQWEDTSRNQYRFALVVATYGSAASQLVLNRDWRIERWQFIK